MSGTHTPEGTHLGAPPTPTVLRLGFARGTAPGKWAKRWAIAEPTIALELIPLSLRGTVPPGEPAPDVWLVRVPPGARPAGTEGPGGDHAIRLYTEAVGVVLPADHELANHASLDHDDLSLLSLLAHPDHETVWPAPAPWADPAWAPRNATATMELVASGAGAALLPLPLARQLAAKRTHVVVEVVGDPPLAGTEIWAHWARDRDAPDVQQLVGIMRGRTARSSRPGAEGTPAVRQSAGATDKNPKTAQSSKRAGSGSSGGSGSKRQGAGSGGRAKASSTKGQHRAHAGRTRKGKRS